MFTDTWSDFPCDFLKQGLGELWISALAENAGLEQTRTVKASGSAAENAEHRHGTTIFWAFLLAALLRFNLENHSWGAEGSPLLCLWSHQVNRPVGPAEWRAQLSAVDFVASLEPSYNFWAWICKQSKKDKWKPLPTFWQDNQSVILHVSLITSVVPLIFMRRRWYTSGMPHEAHQAPTSRSQMGPSAITTFEGIKRKFPSYRL